MTCDGIRTGLISDLNYVWKNHKPLVSGSFKNTSRQSMKFVPLKGSPPIPEMGHSLITDELKSRGCKTPRLFHVYKTDLVHLIAITSYMDQFLFSFSDYSSSV